MNKRLADWLIDEWVIDSQMMALAQQLLRLLFSMYTVSIFKIHALNWVVAPHILLFQSEVENCPLEGWQTLSQIQTQPLCSAPSLEKEYSPLGLIKILVEWKQRHYVSPKPINLFESLRYKFLLSFQD